MDMASFTTAFGDRLKRMWMAFCRHQLIRLLLCALLSCMWSQTDASEKCDSLSLSMMEDTWREFRSRHPFPIQTTGLRHRSDTCIFVMSEPAPWVDKEALGRLFASEGGHLIVCKQPFGLDGYLSDAVGCMRLDSVSFPKFQDKLSELLYGTAYKPYFTDLDNPSPRVYFSSASLNIPINAINWDSLMDNEVFCSSSDNGLTIHELTMTVPHSSSEVLYSKSRGFVLWRLDNRRISYADSLLRANGRRFALDSDLILHFIATDSCTVLVGRERSVPVSVIPPLRCETILQLAISQRPVPSVMLDAAASKTLFNDTTWLTPVLMRGNLHNTEMGALMLLTDMLLKSWSEGGETSDSFMDYPVPGTRLFSNGTSHEPGHDLTYQWLPYCVSTGSLLPVFFPTGKSFSLKDVMTGLERQRKFAGLGCTDLIRLVQYTMVYNAFKTRGQSAGNNAAYGTWMATPTFSVSDRRWRQGGYGLSAQVPVKQIVKASKRAKSLSRAARKASSTGTVLSSGGISMLNKAPVPQGIRQQYHVPPKITELIPEPDISTELFMPRQVLAIPATVSQERGFVPDVHNPHTVSPPQAESPGEIQERTLREKIRNELRMKILQTIERLDALDIQTDITIIALFDSDRNNNRAYAA